MEFCFESSSKSLIKFGRYPNKNLQENVIQIKLLQLWDILKNCKSYRNEKCLLLLDDRKLNE